MEVSASTIADAPAITKRGKRSGREEKGKTSIVENDLQGQASKHRKELDVRSDHHATVDQRLEHLERMLTDSADKHTQWEKMHGEQEKCFGNLAED